MSAREEQLARLQKKRDELNRRIASISAKEQAQKRKEDTRRKVLIGAAMQAAVKRGEWSEEKLRKLLDAGITAKRDREFLGLDDSPQEAWTPPTPAPKLRRPEG